MRKFIIVICLVAVLACMAVPAFAVGNGNGKVYWAPINFDRIHLNGIGQYDYPFNWIDTYSTLQNPAKFVLDDDLDISGTAILSQGVGYNTFSTSFLCPTDKFDLRSVNSFFQVRFLETADYIISNNSNGVQYGFESVTVSFRAWYYYVNPITSEVSRRWSDISRIYYDLGSSVDIGELISGLIYEQSWWNDSLTAACVEDLRIDFDMDFTSGVTPQVWIHWDGTQINENNDSAIFYAQWGGKYAEPQPAPEIPEIDLGTWLRDTVGSFLDFEIFPGFSVDMIFYLILVICIVLWFVKIIS